MTTRKRFEITIESERLLIVRQRHSIRLWCHECRAAADFALLERVARLLDVGSKVVETEQETARDLHILETPGGPLVCLDSVVSWAGEGKTRHQNGAKSET